jgi:hypothetical protein
MLITALFLAATAPKPLLLAHYMPWYAAKPVSPEWGWHWTMGKLNPDIRKGGRVEAASHYRPLIGLYDSGDPQALECQVLLMKFAGIDGVLVDWYGRVDHFDYAVNHRNTERLFAAIKRAGLKFALVYEDQTVTQLIKDGKFKAEDALDQGKRLMRWVESKWFRTPQYLKHQGRPVFLVFGPQYYAEGDWPKLFEDLSPKPAFFTLHHRKGDAAIGAYDWPLPKGGDEGSERERKGFLARAKEQPVSIPVAYPRFHDFYKEAGVHDSWGRINDHDGRTYERTLREALMSGASIVQIATWNDWGEGTGIEPTEEFGYRDLETTRRLRGKSKYSPADLRLPIRLFQLQKRPNIDRKKLDAISRLLFSDRLKEAQAQIEKLE